MALQVEITALITMINDAMKDISVSYSYSVPYIATEVMAMMGESVRYFVRTKNLGLEAKKSRKSGKEVDEELDEKEVDEKEPGAERNHSAIREMFGGKVVSHAKPAAPALPPLPAFITASHDSDSDSDTEDKELQRALIASMMD